MWNRLKKAGCYLLIIVLLPYVVTVFMNGAPDYVPADAGEMYVTVEQEEEKKEVDMNEYCIGRMAKEIPASYEEEALKAQAVIVRTSVYRKWEEEGSGAAMEEDFWTEQEMKEEWGAADYYSFYRKMERAWEETDGQVLLYGENLADTPFTRLTNGNTRDGKEVLGSDEYPYLKIKECPLDIEALEQIQTVTVEEMDAEVTATDTAGYVTEVTVGKEKVSGESFRETNQLASSCFILQKYDGKLRITTRGIGHGLGLSQYTANEMAKEGKKSEEILSYFFEGTKIKEVAEIVRNSENTE